MNEFSLRKAEYSGDTLIAYYLSALVGAVNRQTDMQQREMNRQMGTLVGAMNRQTDALVRTFDAQTKDQGKWLAIIAEAVGKLDLGDGDDAATQRRIDQLTARLKASSSAVGEAIKRQQPGD